MSDIIKTEQKPNLEYRYRLLNRFIDAALFKYHPDHYRGDKPQVSEKMTRKLLATKRDLRRVYEDLKGKPKPGVNDHERK